MLELNQPYDLMKVTHVPTYQAESPNSSIAANVGTVISSPMSNRNSTQILSEFAAVTPALGPKHFGGESNPILHLTIKESA